MLICRILTADMSFEKYNYLNTVLIKHKEQIHTTAAINQISNYFKHREKIHAMAALKQILKLHASYYSNGKYA